MWSNTVSQKVLLKAISHHIRERTNSYHHEELFTRKQFSIVSPRRAKTKQVFQKTLLKDCEFLSSGFLCHYINPLYVQHSPEPISTSPLWDLRIRENMQTCSSCTRCAIIKSSISSPEVSWNRQHKWNCDRLTHQLASKVLISESSGFFFLELHAVSLLPETFSNLTIFLQALIDPYKSSEKPQGLMKTLNNRGHR